MKKTSLFLAVLCMAVLCHAQPEVGTLSIQPKVGINVANVTDDDISKPRVGVAGGIELQHQIISRLGISYGILYSMQGAKEKVNNVSATLKTDYLAVPILANVYLFKGLALKTGIQPAFNVIDKGTLSSEGHSSTGSISNTTNEIKPFDFGIPFGLSYEFNNVVLDARYILGLTEYWDLPSSFDEEFNSHHRVFQFTIGYRFSR